MPSTRRQQCIFLLLASIAGISSIRLVRVPRGPLYRVEGAHTIIPCNVTNDERSGDQDFWWSVFKHNAAIASVGVISTRDSEYPDSSYVPRVRAKEIYIQKLSRTSVQLHLVHLQKDDEGEYECRTDKNSRVYLASPNAKVELKVLTDTLLLTGPSDEPPRLALREGEPLALQCRAAALTALHTHLSVTFSLSRTGHRGRETVIGIGRDLTVQSQEQGMYWARYARGQIGVEKVKSDAYHLRVDHVKPQDAGLYHCTAAEWIEDPDGRWNKILERTIPLAEVSVQANDVKLGAVASVAPATFYRGDSVDLHCNVTLGPEQEDAVLLLSVGWWGADEEPLALVDHRGVSLPTVLRGMSAAGSEVSTDRPSPLCFRLRIHRAKKGDQGLYRCEVTCRAQRQGTSGYQVAFARSEPVTLFLYLSASDTLLIPMVTGVAVSLTVTITIIASVTCCFLRRLAKR
ncbi:immunoglobulin superfamily member 8-like [Scyliorhinus torazame]|uniref:immunoglobulin superfamily member 8-like n=1 Tax=Scyliorhinus torazame TaxID=75743 RepID=UPI003B598B00